MPEQSLTEFLNADLAGTGDTAEATPEVAAETTATPTETPAADPADTATGDDLGFDPADVQANPEAAKRMQAAWTRKTQELAEQRKQLEGIDPGVLDWTRRLNEALVYDPASARQMLLEAQAQFDQQSATPPALAIEDGWVTDQERQLADRLTRLEQQTTLANNQATVRQQLDAVERDLGVSIPYEQRLALWTEMTREKVPFQHAGIYWRGRYGVEQIRQKAREEGLKSAATKAQMPAPPSGVVSRDIAAPVQRAGSLLEHLERELASS